MLNGEYPAKSSMFDTLNYDAANMILTITFTMGTKYQYSDVPPQVFSELLNAESQGKYFTANIKNKYKTVKVP